MHDASPARMRELIMGFRATQIVSVAAQLGLADCLRDGARSARQMATAVGADALALHRLLRALACLGVLAPTGDDSFELTPLGESLRSDRPQSLRGMAALYGQPWLWQAYGALMHSVRTGQSAFDQVHGQPFFDFLADRPDEAAVFDDAMSTFSANEVQAIAQAYPEFESMQHVVDVGGGRGVLLHALLRRHAHLHGTLFDRESVIAAAQQAPLDAAIAARLQCVAGDFFERVEPAGADAYLLKSVIHDWDDAAASALLFACRAAMAEGRSRLLLIERLLPDDAATPSDAALFDINMLVTVGGKERSASEYAALLAGTELRMTRVLPTECGLSIVEAVPV